MPVEESTLRVAIFLLAFTVLLAAQKGFPARRRTDSSSARPMANIVLFLSGIVIVKLLGPLVAINAALFAQANDVGLIYALDLSGLWIWFLAFLLLDASIYFQHLLSHKVDLLWRFHRVHHADNDIDVTTALRFHPLEIAFSMLYKCVVVVFLGAPWWVVVVFEILLNSSAMFNHANLRIHHRLEPYVRSVIVTPSMHLVHHSKMSLEQNSNYGFCLSIWDRIFNTYRAARKEDHEENIGMAGVDRTVSQKLSWVFLSPFRATRGQG